jgi:hypothetical protein
LTRAVLLRGIAGLTQKLKEARGNERRLEEDLARAKAAARQVKALLEIRRGRDRPLPLRG